MTAFSERSSGWLAGKYRRCDRAVDKRFEDNHRSRFAVVDSVYACQLSADQSLLFTANRGLNHITVYDYPSNQMRLRVKLPALHEFVPMSARGDLRLGLHHGALCSPKSRS